MVFRIATVSIVNDSCLRKWKNSNIFQMSLMTKWKQSMTIACRRVHTEPMVFAMFIYHPISPLHKIQCLDHCGFVKMWKWFYLKCAWNALCWEKIVHYKWHLNWLVYDNSQDGFIKMMFVKLLSSCLGCVIKWISDSNIWDQQVSLSRDTRLGCASSRIPTQW